MDIQRFVNDLAAQEPEEGEHEPFEAVLKGQAVELWSTVSGRLFLVADEPDAVLAMARYGATRGEVYTGAEAQKICSIGDPSVVAELHEWKRTFNAVLRGN